MSICPGKDLYSAYIDGEVPSPWKEKLEAHLKNCSHCTQVVEQYKRLQSFLASSPNSSIDVAESFLRLNNKKNTDSYKPRYNVEKENWFKKSVKIPLPLLAAVALFLFVFTPIFMFQIKSSKPTQQIIISNFRPIIPMSKSLKVGKTKLSFNGLKYLETDYANNYLDRSVQNISFNGFSQSYVPLSMGTGIIFEEFEANNILLQKELEEFVLTYMENGK